MISRTFSIILVHQHAARYECEVVISALTFSGSRHTLWLSLCSTTSKSDDARKAKTNSFISQENRQRRANFSSKFNFQVQERARVLAPHYHRLDFLLPQWIVDREAENHFSVDQELEVISLFTSETSFECFSIANYSSSSITIRNFALIAFEGEVRRRSKFKCFAKRFNLDSTIWWLTNIVGGDKCVQ